MPQQQLGAKKRSKAQKEQLLLLYQCAGAATLEPSVDSLKASLSSMQEKLEATQFAFQCCTILTKLRTNVQAFIQLCMLKGKNFSTLLLENVF